MFIMFCADLFSWRNQNMNESYRMQCLPHISLNRIIPIVNIRANFGHTPTSDNFLWTEICLTSRTLHELWQFFSETCTTSHVRQAPSDVTHIDIADVTSYRHHSRDVIRCWSRVPSQCHVTAHTKTLMWHNTHTYRHMPTLLRLHMDTGHMTSQTQRNSRHVTDVTLQCLERDVTHLWRHTSASQGCRSSKREERFLFGVTMGQGLL